MAFLRSSEVASQDRGSIPEKHHPFLFSPQWLSLDGCDLDVTSASSLSFLNAFTLTSRLSWAMGSCLIGIVSLDLCFAIEQLWELRQFNNSALFSSSGKWWQKCFLSHWPMRISESLRKSPELGWNIPKVAAPIPYFSPILFSLQYSSKFFEVWR